MNSYKFKNLINKNHMKAIEMLTSKTHEVYLVGGSVRDTIMNIDVNDVDITTSATVDEILEIFANNKTYGVGNDHGTVPVIIGGESIEITTYRGNRDEGLLGDVSKRDFTMNAIAYKVEDGIIDYFDGISDIKNRVVKCVGNPSERFKEDPLRILRGLRFASKYGFTIESNTLDSMYEGTHLLSEVSPERLSSELNKLLMGTHAKDVLDKHHELITTFIPELKPMVGFNQNNPHHIYNVWEHSTLVMENTKEDIAHKLAGLFHDSGKPSTYSFNEKKGYANFLGHADVSVKIANKVMTRLRYSNKLKSQVLNIIKDHEETLSLKPYKIKKNIFEKGVSRFEDMIEFKIADDSSKKTIVNMANYNKINDVKNDFLSNDPVLSHKDIDFNPKILIEMGYKGSEISKKLNELCLLVISGNMNNSENLKKYLKSNP